MTEHKNTQKHAQVSGQTGGQTGDQTGDQTGSQALLQVNDLSVVFGGQDTAPVVSDVSFELYRGETLALVGESGSGKSVTALSVLQLLPYPLARHPSGSIVFKGDELVGAPADQLMAMRGDRIGMIFQEPMTSLNPLHTLEKQINEVLLEHKGLNASEARTRTLELLDLVGLENFKDRLGSYPHQLSGGQRQRVMIAMALANEPDILIADEPTTALDVTIQAQILSLLVEIQKKLSLSILLITHDLTVVRNVAHRVCVMQHGRIVEHGDTQSVFDHPQHPYTQELIDSEPRGRAPSVAENAKVVLEATDLKVWFPIKKGLLRRTTGYVKAVDGVSLTLREGETVGIVGESGSGKSTLALALLQLIPSTGSVLFMGEALSGLDRKALREARRHMQIVFQDPYGSLSPRMSVGQIILEGLLAHQLGGSSQENETRVIESLQTVGLPEDARFRYPHEFSGGQRQRIAVARAMILKPALIILDEPTSALDRAVQVQMVELLRELQQRFGLSYLFISHDLTVVRAMSNQLLVMRQGQVVEQGDVNQIFESPQHDYTAALIRAATEII